MFVYRSFAAIEMNKQPISHKLFAKRQWYERWDGVKSSLNCLTFCTRCMIHSDILSHLFMHCYGIQWDQETHQPTNIPTHAYFTLYFTLGQTSNIPQISYCAVFIDPKLYTDMCFCWYWVIDNMEWSTTEKIRFLILRARRQLKTHLNFHIFTIN